jgi:hypothetical protein
MLSQEGYDGGDFKEDKMRLRTFGYTTLLLLLLAGGNPSGICQEATDENLETQQLQERAFRVQQRYPWLIQQDRGLALFAINTPREEFLRGVNAATDLVFEGTEELPPTITLNGFFPSIEEALKKLGELDPSLRQTLDLKGMKGRFFHPEDTTAGLSDDDLVKKYRRQKAADATQPNSMGAFFAGNLIIDGTLIPPPVQIDVVQNREISEVHVLANKNIIERFKYTDPFLLDQELLQADTPDKFRRAVQSKADRIWHQVSQVPFSGTGEQMMLTASQLSAIYGIVVAKVEGSSIRFETADGKKFTWSPKSGQKGILLTEPDAFQMAYNLQTKLFNGLGSGGVVFCSIKFGIQVIPDGFYFMTDLKKIASEEGFAEGEKARKIRDRWPEQADWILEYYYTSLMDEIAQAPPNPLLNSPLVFPLPTPLVPDLPKGQEAPRAPEDILKELLEKQK